MTRRGKLLRLHQLAGRALNHHDLHVAQIALHRYSTNPVYRVDTSTGERFCLRLASPGWRTESDLQAEAFWLQALRRDTDIPVPHVVSTPDGNTVLPMRMNGAPEVWYATLMSWQPGRLLGYYLTPENLHRLGGLSARLHIHGKDWTPPTDFGAGVFEHFLSRGEPDVLFHEPQLTAYAGRDLEQLQRLHERVESSYASLDRRDLRVIHCDLWHDNVKLYRGVLYPFDFEDTIRGFRLHDIAMAMLDLLQDVGNDRYPSLLESFRRGYEEHLEWPDGEMEILQVGRLLWKINYVARFERTYLGAVVDYHRMIFDRYEQDGELWLPDR